MRIDELFKPEHDDCPKLVVIYGGRFQPFHKGHYQAYKWLCKKFGAENVWLATSNKTNFKKDSDDVSPFTYKEKVEIMVGLYEIKPRRIVECKNPTFRPSEVFSQYKGYPLVYVAACGGKDDDRYTENKFFQPLPNDTDPYDLKTLKEDVGYYVVVPTKVDGVSGSAAREELTGAEGDKQRMLFKKFFGTYDETIADLVTARLKEVK